MSDSTENGRSEMRLAFKPGMEVDGEVVCRTFQPSFVVTGKGTLLAFCQGRLMNGNDNQPKVVLVNRSHDLGKTWEGARAISAPMNHFAISAYAVPREDGERVSFLTGVGLKVTKDYYKNDPALMKDRTGIDLDLVGMDRAAVLCRYYSDDDGVTWKLDCMTGEHTPLNRDYNGFVPVFLNTIGQVHVIEEGPHAGRFIVAVPIWSAAENEPVTDNFRNHTCTGSGVIYSDDSGETWRMDGMITDYLANEASAVSIDQGRKILMIRRLNAPDRLKLSTAKLRPGIAQRVANISADGGATWSEPFLLNISHVKCHGTLARVGSRLYFSIPKGPENMSKDDPWDADRCYGSIYFSDDVGKTWRHRVVEDGSYSYSSVGKLTDDLMVTFFARGGMGQDGIGYRTFTDSWLDEISSCDCR